ncbi:MAG TPA: glycosyltransferase family 2 protein [Sphingomicrobium sp.]|nr:glycosyltransferase family 2 protein [Sphingomicrobium sp.]
MTRPIVSALMPTADRRRFVPQAIAQFLAQNRDDAELLILDDGNDPVSDLIPADPRIRYLRDSPRRPLGDKRNRLCELARGDIILHWDDDDWYAPDRIARQVAALEASGADICGLDRVIFLSEDGERAWDYVYRGGGRWVCGASLAYRRSFWERHRFAPIAAGEDTRWVFGAAGAAIHSMADNDFLVSRVHGGNTCPKRTDGGFYHKRDPGPVRAMVAGFARPATSLPARRSAALRIRIGIHVCSRQQDLAATLRALHENTSLPFELVVLDDFAPGEAGGLGATAVALPQLRHCRIPAPGGAPACFNQLVGLAADIYVFLEGGALPGAGWLDLLVGALEADPANGLAGPSTNRCWNEQGVTPGCAATACDLTQQTRALLHQHGHGRRSMAPLYSLSDFCFVVRKEVVAAIGAADPVYGRGPCWEMDYAVRAARAGFASVWAQAAFVHRAPFPTERMTMEQRLFEVNKRAYQDRFCGRRFGTAGRGAPYRNHCRGDDCANFAPATITLSLPLPAAQAETCQLGPELPLISCIMPTQGRPAFVAQAIAYFQRQDYPARELVIVHHEDSDLPEGKAGPGLRFVRTSQASIGGMRNAAVEAARGDIIAHWDDDDWHGPRRLSRQATPILQGIADITGFNDTLFMIVPTREFWSVSPELYARLFVENINGGTMMFRREIWRRSGPYPRISLREDAELLMRAVRDGARLCRLRGRDDYVYVRHGRNTWNFPEGRYLQRDEWFKVDEPETLAPDLDFYFADRNRPEPMPDPRLILSRTSRPRLSMAGS